MKVCVTGSRGMLGSDVCHAFSIAHRVFDFDIEDFDITDGLTTRKLVSGVRPDLVVHCAAYTDVDGAEREKAQAMQVNAHGTENVALACQESNAAMVYISTDYVFDGEKQTPYVEGDPTNPLNVYGRSKLEGEESVRRLLTRFYIVRTGWLYGRNGRSFVDKILERADFPEFAGGLNEIPVVHDQVGSPTFTVDLAQSITTLVSTNRFGLYHLSNGGYCSWYEFAQRIFEYLGSRIRLKPIGSSALRQPARRPGFSALDSRIWGTLVGRRLRSWDEALADFLSARPQSSAAA